MNNIWLLQANKNAIKRRTTFSIQILVILYVLLLLISQLTSPTVAYFDDSETVTITISTGAEEQEELMN
ncbi:SipW-dependent-type signal peptide-containing protein [Gracilibacillus thailandensis]|uniref:Uncharacterized protein n=1 Tax=Gracilibacillus thailandensis TaxID=563735 RepID=A0A6N7R018_9BACI|nr:SipW-dependent-type signal peptide-containing protein [Gracilibacillus thailandensis]MRI67668.1 hypothetical protein [Gracilibacillus thailandensis]